MTDSTGKYVLRDSIAIALAVNSGEDIDFGPDLAKRQRYSDANAILAMPEMRAIHALLMNLVENNAVGFWDFGGTKAGREYLRRRGAPESVVQWLLPYACPTCRDSGRVIRDNGWGDPT